MVLDCLLMLLMNGAGLFRPCQHGAGFSCALGSCRLSARSCSANPYRQGMRPLTHTQCIEIRPCMHQSAFTIMYIHICMTMHMLCMLAGIAHASFNIYIYIS